PQRLLFGKIAYHVVNEVYTKRLNDIQNWKEVSIAAHGH
ncbi:MAG: short-chain dehydrogenase/reductase, partial [Chryseobacterium sp.]